MKFKSFPDKIAYLNQLFINKPYKFNALGEGMHGYFDNGPLYRTDVFDCETYVDTIMALALADNLESFKSLMQKIRYKDGKIAFIKRNHFTCVDWNTNNQAQGFIKDITNSIYDENHNNINAIAHTIIDKPNWYKNISLQRINIQNISLEEKNKRLTSLKNKSKYFKPIPSNVTYIPLDNIIKPDNTIDNTIIKQVPNGAIIEIVRPNWDLFNLIGTNLNIAHLGFVVWDNNTPYFIHASSDKMMVMKVPLIEYLKNAKTNPKVKGINIQTIVY